MSLLLLDITSLVKEVVETDALNFGFVVKLDSEDPYRNLAFSSSNVEDENKRPLWEVCYTTPKENIEELALDIELELTSIYPNPSSGEVYFSEPFARVIYDVLGNQIVDLEEALSVDLTDFEKGLLIFSEANGSITKVIVE